MAAITEAARRRAEEGHALTVSRLLAAPRALVFKLWTDPAHAARWWGPQGFALLECDLEAREGGLIRRVMRGPDGVRCCKRGTFREITPPERLVFTYADEDEAGALGPVTLVTVTFEEAGIGTLLTLRQTLFTTIALRDGHERGWTSALQRLAEHLGETAGGR